MRSGRLEQGSLSPNHKNRASRDSALVVPAGPPPAAIISATNFYRSLLRFPCVVLFAVDIDMFF